MKVILIHCVLQTSNSVCVCVCVCVSLLETSSELSTTMRLKTRSLVIYQQRAQTPSSFNHLCASHECILCLLCINGSIFQYCRETLWFWNISSRTLKDFQGQECSTRQIVAFSSVSGASRVISCRFWSPEINIVKQRKLLAKLNFLLLMWNIVPNVYNFFSPDQETRNVSNYQNRVGTATADSFLFTFFGLNENDQCQCSFDRVLGSLFIEHCC